MLCELSFFVYNVTLLIDRYLKQMSIWKPAFLNCVSFSISRHYWILVNFTFRLGFLSSFVCGEIQPRYYAVANLLHLFHSLKLTEFF